MARYRNLLYAGPSSPTSHNVRQQTPMSFPYGDAWGSDSTMMVVYTKWPSKHPNLHHNHQEKLIFHQVF